jgi:hypothetical protein
VAVILALYFQFVIGPTIVTDTKHFSWIPGLRKLLYQNWRDGSCSKFDDSKNNIELLKQCAGNAGVFRPMLVATVFFLGSAVAARVQPGLNREAWPAKFTLFGIAVLITMFLSNAPLFTGLYLWIARLGATLFVLIEQIILIDVAYNWNEEWVDRADQADRLVYGSGNYWLQAIVATCAGFYVTTLIGIILLFHYFGGSGCADNNWIISLTLVGVIALTGIQLAGKEGSLLTSSIMSLYVTYLAYSMVSKNPNGHCNPQLGGSDVTGIAIGLTLTAVSVAWAGWSWTAEERLNVEGAQTAKTVTGGATVARSDGTGVNLDVPFLDPGDAPTSGHVLDTNDEESFVQNRPGRDVWKLNVVMALISCWVAMTLTGWGTLEAIMSGDDQESYRAANPTVGRFNMAMIGISQWCAIVLYIWTLIAPVLYPDRDFS